ncbi:MAG: YbhN family protein [Bacteroidia bacterium]
MEFNLKNILKFVIFLGLGLALLGWAFKNMDLKQMFEEIKNANYFWIFIGMFCGVLAHASRALRWNLLLQPIGYKANNWNTFYAVMIGYFSNNLVPRLGEVTRCAALAKTDKIPVEKLFGTVFIERVIDLIITLIVTLFIFISQFDLLNGFLNDTIYPMMGSKSGGGSSIKFIILGILVFGGLVVFIMRNKIKNLTIYKKAANIAKGFVEGIKSVLKLEKPWLFIAHSIFIWGMYFAMAYFTFFSYAPSAHLGYQAGLIVLFLGTVAVILPIPGGIGVYHNLVSLGLVLFGLTKEEGITYATISHAAQMIMIFVVGLISMVMISNKLRKKVTMEDVL